MKVLEGQVQRMSAELNNSTVVLQPLVKKLPDKSVKSVANQIPQEQPKSRAEVICLEKPTIEYLICTCARPL